MKKSLYICSLVAALLLCSSPGVFAQSADDFRKVDFAERNLGGPRLGLTFIPGGGNLSKELEKEGIRSVISQFGWHFEWQVVPEGGGPQFVVQLVPLVAGVEYGKFLFSATLGLGIRLPSGIEFGLGLNLLLAGQGATTALMATIGKSFNYSGVSIPINLVWVTNPDGNRFGIMVGYAIGE